MLDGDRPDIPGAVSQPLKVTFQPLSKQTAKVFTFRYTFEPDSLDKTSGTLEANGDETTVVFKGRKVRVATPELFFLGLH